MWSAAREFIVKRSSGMFSFGEFTSDDDSDTDKLYIDENYVPEEDTSKICKEITNQVAAEMANGDPVDQLRNCFQMDKCGVSLSLPRPKESYKEHQGIHLYNPFYMMVIFYINDYKYYPYRYFL